VFDEAKIKRRGSNVNFNSVRQRLFPTNRGIKSLGFYIFLKRSFQISKSISFYSIKIVNRGKKIIRSLDGHAAISIHSLKFSVSARGIYKEIPNQEVYQVFI
jgi:hypothetical protein